MKVLLLCPLFSGLADGLASKAWQPQGVPAVVKLLEQLHRETDIDMRTVFAVRDRSRAACFSAAENFELAEIGPVEIWPWRYGGPRFVDRVVTEIDHIRRAIGLVRRMRPDVVYATFGLVNCAAAIARLRLAPVVLRLMGIFPYQRQIAKRPLSPGGFALRSKFAHVVCTEEGSDPANVLGQLLDPEVPRSILLNGVDAPEIDAAAVERLKRRYGLGARPVVLFVGRLEPYKGCFEFLGAAVEYLSAKPGTADFVILGDGTSRSEMERYCRDNNLFPAVHFAGSVPSGEVPVWLRLADVYVSLNQHGNLSNANLEALAMGACVVIPGEDRAGQVDISTSEILRPDVVLRYDRADAVHSIASLLTQLLSDPDAIRRYRANAAALARSKFKSWSSRVAQEIDLLRTAASG